VRHILDYTGSFYLRWNRTLVQRLVDRWEIPVGRRAGTLSVGELQKLALVLALGHEPRLLVLDEPVAALDPVARREFLKVVLEIAVGGERTVIFSTHITSDLERVADRVAILQHGQISFFGELGELKDQVKRLAITSHNSFPERFALPGLLRQRIEGNQALVTTRLLTSQLIEQIETEWHATVEVQDLNLEDGKPWRVPFRLRGSAKPGPSSAASCAGCTPGCKSCGHLFTGCGFGFSVVVTCSWRCGGGLDRPSECPLCKSQRPH